jgi:iron complex transport system ATP-binding protein
MADAVEIQNLDFAYPAGAALRDVTVSIARGEFFVIIGPNGSGKTTLLKLIAGIERAGPGRIRVLDRPLHRFGRKELAKTIALVPQLVPEQFPFRVRDVVMMGRAPHLGMLGLERDSDVRRVDEAMRFTGIGRLADRKMDELSGGERQRVLIARAICQEPKIILLDEPTAALDLAHQVRIMDLMDRLKIRRQVTVIMVSHDVNIAAMYGSRLLLLKDGSVVKIGTAKDVLTYPTLEDAYGCPLLVDESPLGGFPRVTLVPGRFLT